MRIAINLAAVKTIGTRVYTKGILPPMTHLSPDDEFIVFMSPLVQELVGNELPANVVQCVSKDADNVLVRVAWEQTVLPLELAKWRPDVLFAAFEFSPLWSPCPILLGIHNPSPHLDNSLGNRLRRRLSLLSCRVAEKVIFVSQDSAADLGRKLHVPKRKRVVVHHGTDPSRWAPHPDPQSVLKEYGLETNPYFLYVSNLYRYKKPDTLIKAFTLWRERSGRNEYKLILTGKSDPDFQVELDALVKAAGLENDIKFLGHIPMEHIPALYQNTQAFVLPTSVETFGQPFVEAMYCAAPIVCADIPVAREVCGDSALYFPVDDIEALAQLLDKVCDPAVKADLSKRSHDRSPLFSFEREAKEILHLLHELGDKKTASRK